MINKDNFKELLKELKFIQNEDIFYKDFPNIDTTLKVDFKEGRLIYPEDKGLTINGEYTTSFSENENFVVFECVNRLLEKGYKPQHIELEPQWNIGHGPSGGRADIMVRDNSKKSFLIIECKTAGREFNKEWNKTLINGGQLFSYAKQAGSTQFISLYTCDYIDKKVIPSYYLITLKDNKKLLEELVDREPLSYEKAKLLDKEDIYQAWKDTYAQDYSTRGIFEEDIQSYKIGKTKYSLKDLNTISSTDIQGKYHQFATILRQHNVSGRENAFDKLVNLLLCKIVDETNNPEELKFYWKGIAYDNFFDLQDRLQKLYQEGMKRFLAEDVVYIDNKAIDEAFRFFKKDPDATKDTIKRYFKQLKFFTNNDFSFIDIHNEKLFYQNATILLKIVKMIQDIHLKTEEENQFLGDMFEGFLDQGIKQSEGQYFTPIPITKFILKSLPLEDIITKSDQIPKVIDYACGAGHFLNEYAKEIKSIVKQNKENNIEEYYKSIVGIEKEYRLSKVAKVSSFMYGQDDINIIYADALGTIPDINDNEYSILIANPPYSVKGFLETLNEEDRKRYELINTIEEKSYPNNNSIETFFIERAMQLLKPNGVAGIIVPASILTNKSAKLYEKTRELLITYFDVVAMVELPSNTFGKTTTNTITLFIRKKKENPVPAEHYKNRVNDWFSGNKDKDIIFEDEHLIKAYCNYRGLKFEDYQMLLRNNSSYALLDTEIFREYKKHFDGLSETKNRKKQSSFKRLSKEQRDMELEKLFIKYLHRIEKEKLYYFILAHLNPQKVLIVNSPSKLTEIKKFLGYEWSDAKGNEGIKYLGGHEIESIEESKLGDKEIPELEDGDKRVISNIFNLSNIKTPLYDPMNKYNEQKINYLIYQNFCGKNPIVPEELSEYASLTNLTNLIDFETLNFNKSISLISEKIHIDGNSGKYPMEKIENLLKSISGNKTRINKNEIQSTGRYPVITQTAAEKVSGYSDNSNGNL